MPASYLQIRILQGIEPVRRFKELSSSPKPLAESAAKQIVRLPDAKLIRRPNGQHELVGGTDADRANAFEWSSLFAHEIVFTHFHREDYIRSRRRQSHFKTRFASANFATGQNGASICGHCF